MKKTKKFLRTFSELACLTLLGFALSSCTINNKQEEKARIRTVTVSGTGSVNVKPDQISLTFTVKTTDWVVNTATTANAATTEKVIAAIMEAGVARPDIQTYDYKITQETYWSNAKEYPGKYTVTNSLNVRIRNTEIAGNVIDAAIKNGTNALSNFEYSVSDTTTALREARTMAIQKANDAANLLAGASGCKVDRVLDIQEGYTSTNSNAKMMLADGVGNGATPIQEGTIAVTSNVTITYSLLD